MNKIFSRSGIIKCFRVLSILEALSWFFLLTAMYMKHIQHNPHYIRTAGLTHGILFLFFLTFTILTSVVQRWQRSLLAIAILAGIVPGGAVVFDVYALKKGYLQVLLPNTKDE